MVYNNDDNKEKTTIERKKIKRYEFNINDNAIIEDSINKDALKRNKKLNGLIKLINTIDKSTILSVDGDWGSGKTVFVKQLEFLAKSDMDISDFDKEELRDFRNHFMIYYYNAWENDFHKYPILSIMYKIINDFPEQKIEALKDNKTIPAFLNNIIKTITNGIIDINDDTSFVNLVQEIQTSEEIKNSLNAIVDNLIAENKSKIVIIIDELDRCNPNFAVKTLEAIKQFYNNDNLIFIVATNNNQLCSTICKHYGETFDSALYLNKFYNFIIHLDNIEIKNYLENYLSFKDDSYYSRLIPHYLMKKMHFTYREINSYVSTLDVLDKYFKKNNSFHDYFPIIQFLIVPYALAIKVKSIKEYASFINGNELKKFVNMFTSDVEMNNIVNRIISQNNETKDNGPEVITDIYNALFNSAFDDYNNKYHISLETRRDLSEVLSLVSFI